MPEPEKKGQFSGTAAFMYSPFNLLHTMLNSAVVGKEKGNRQKAVSVCMARRKPVIFLGLHQQIQKRRKTCRRQALRKTQLRRKLPPVKYNTFKFQTPLKSYLLHGKEIPLEQTASTNRQLHMS